jgi:hypothetical protein
VLYSRHSYSSAADALFSCLFYTNLPNIEIPANDPGPTLAVFSGGHWLEIHPPPRRRMNIPILHVPTSLSTHYIYTKANGSLMISPFSGLLARFRPTRRVHCTKLAVRSSNINKSTDMMEVQLARAVLIGVVPYRAHNKNSCMQCTATVACAVTSHPNCKE